MATLNNTVSSTGPKKDVQSRRSIFLDYLLAASTHGLRSMGRAYSTFNRIFWIISFTTAFGFMLYFVITAARQYYAYPTQTKIDIRLDRNMAFPAVTVCNGNPFRYDRVNQSLGSYFYKTNQSNTTFNQTFINSLIVPLIVDLVNKNETEKLRWMGFQLSDILLQCTYNKIDCSNSFTPSFSTVYGNCFTFNWQTSQKLFTLNDFGNNYVSKEGLSMQFYIAQEMYFPSLDYDTGLAVLIHDNNELPLPNEDSLSLQPGSSHLITYRKTKTTFLPTPYTNCTSDVSTDMDALYKTTFDNDSATSAIFYSESVCLELCEQAYIFSRCSCVIPVPFLTRSVLTLDGHLIFANFCSPFEGTIDCSYAAKQYFSASEQLQTLWCSRCNSPCENINFISVLSAQAAPTDAVAAYWQTVLLNETNTTTKILLPNDFAQRFDYYFNRNYIKVRVACGSHYVTEYQQEAKISVTDTFSAIGGQTGL